MCVDKPKTPIPVLDEQPVEPDEDDSLTYDSSIDSSSSDSEDYVATPQARFHRVLNAWYYLTLVKAHFIDQPNQYKVFLNVLLDFSKGLITTETVIDRVTILFHDKADLLRGFKKFLPSKYRCRSSNCVCP